MQDKIYLKLEGHSQTTAMQEIIRICLKASVEITDELKNENFVLSSLEKTEDKLLITTTIIFMGRQGKESFEYSLSPEKNYNQNATNGVKLAFYRLFSRLFDKTLPWGMQTGIRPALLAMKYNLPFDQTIKRLMDDYDISREKAELACLVAENEKTLLKAKPRRGISLYIGVPFCPTRCLYCSFVSLPLSKQKRNILPAYAEALSKEIEYVGKMIKEEGEILDSIYIGGGTPTSFDNDSLKTVLNTVKNSFDINSLYEYTIEAGRADTITLQKLETIKSLTPSSLRISINPQTLNDGVLKAIGRNHTAQEFINSFNMARSLGFSNINCDIIAGLPFETKDMFLNSLKQLCTLHPENITMHTMCVKRAASLKNAENTSCCDEEVTQGVSMGGEILKSNGYIPYYMYRQKDTIGGLENTGYSLPGHEGLYNVLMMEDISTVIGLGAGGVSKLLDHKTGKIERVYNYKDPWEYINNFDEMLNRKRLK
ncbi:MAG: coproporphyrinogen dehydrogenase HemZ [Clostridia bacterium]|nr:coproporphyrinogen dehydrogenase HemZ [Clostridia bacterium]